MDWLRWWHGTCADPKWRAIAKKSGASLCEVLGIWAWILEYASVNSCGRGSIEGLDHDVCAAGLDLDTKRVKAVFAAMEGLVLDKSAVKAWEKRQPKREDSSADRMRALRLRHAASHDAPRRVVTRGDAPDTEKRYIRRGDYGGGGAPTGRVGVNNSPKRVDYSKPENRQAFAFRKLTEHLKLTPSQIEAALEANHPKHAPTVAMLKEAARAIRVTWIAPGEPGYDQIASNLRRTARGGPDFE